MQAKTTPSNLEQAITSAIDAGGGSGGGGNDPTFLNMVKQLLLALYAFFRATFGSKMEAGLLDTLAELKLAKIKPYLKPVAWDTAAPSSIAQAQQVENLHRPLRLVASIEEMGDPCSFEFVNEGKPALVETRAVRLVDANGDVISAINVAGADLVETVRYSWRKKRPVEFLGFPVALPKTLNKKLPDKGVNSALNGFHFYVHGVRPSTSTLDLIGARNKERWGADLTLKKLAADEMSPLDYIVSTLIENLNIAGTAQFPLLRDLLEFAALQSLAVGRIDHSPARLHGIVVGPPGRGKKLVGLAGRILNPSCAELSASKVSAAGLVGASYRTDQGWQSQPGVLELAGEGLVWLQDAQGWTKTEVRKLATTLQEAMEDGVVRDSVAGGERRETPVALLIDLNRAAHLGAVGASTGDSPLLSLRPVLSRADLIVEIPNDVKQTWAVAAAILDNIGGSSSIRLDDQNWVRELKVLVAMLRDLHPTVDIEPARAAMKEQFALITDENEALFEEMPEAGDFPARLNISFARYVLASARTRNASKANNDDVARAMRFLRMKLEFLKLNIPKLNESTTYGISLETFLAQRLGQEVFVDKIVEEYMAASKMSVSTKTVNRALKRMHATKLGAGHYLLPPK